MTEVEVVVLAFHGGPWDGGRLMAEGEWPPPDEIASTADDSGHYAKTTQSQLPPLMEHVMRGATYDWVAR